jgi:hypothetical protein
MRRIVLLVGVWGWVEACCAGAGAELGTTQFTMNSSATSAHPT